MLDCLLKSGPLKSAASGCEEWDGHTAFMFVSCIQLRHVTPPLPPLVFFQWSGGDICVTCFLGVMIYPISLFLFHFYVFCVLMHQLSHISQV